MTLGSSVCRRLCACALFAFVSACATAPVAPVAAPRVQLAAIDRVSVMAQTDDFLILNVPEPVPYQALAERYLGNANMAGVLIEANGEAAPGPGRPTIVPLRPSNASAVFYDGYQTVPVLCYHRFSEGGSDNLMVVSRASFRQQMQYLKDNGYNVITLAQLDGFLHGELPIPPRSVVITMDDGFRSAYEIAYPILREFNFPATFFIYTDFVGPRLALDWPAIAELQNTGLIDIQSHSKSHTSFAPTPAEDNDRAAYQRRLQDEIETPQRILEQRLGTPIRYLAYPYGDTSANAIDILAGGTHRLALTVERGGNPSFGDRFVVRRSMIFGDATIEDFREALETYEPMDLD